MPVLPTLLLALLTPVVTRGVSEPKPPFSALSLEEAQQRSRAQGRLLLVDLTASWCAPCRRMEETTWVDPGVIQWVQDHAIAIQIDVDDHSEVAQRLGVTSIPTMILYRGEGELSRHSGLLEARSLLEWVRNPERRPAPPSSATWPQTKKEQEVDERFGRAQFLLVLRNYAEALEETVWLWSNMPDSGVRHSFFAGHVQKLILTYPPARERFEGPLEDLQRQIDAGPVDRAIWNDWMTLCRALDEKQRLLLWYSSKVAPDGSLHAGDWALDDVFEDLVRQRRYADAGRLRTHPVAWAKRQAEFHRMLQDFREQRGTEDESILDRLRGLLPRRHKYGLVPELSSLSASLTAAGRDQEAEQVAGILLTEEDRSATRIRLAEDALRFGSLRPFHVEILWKADRNDPEVKELQRTVLRSLNRSLTTSR